MAIPKNIELLLCQYFGGKRCVITDTTDGNVNWHHLDESASDTNRNDNFANIIPLAWGFNDPLGKAFSAATAGGRIPLGGPLWWESLSDQAMLHYRNWELALAYGCARLAVFVARDYGQDSTPDDVLRLAARAFWFARHRLNYALLSDVITRDILPLLENPAVRSPSTEVVIVYEICSLLNECGDRDSTSDSQNTLDTLLTRLQGSVDDPFRYAGTIRRQVVVRMASEGLDADMLAMLDDSERAAPENPSVQVGAALTRAWNQLSQGDWNNAYDTLRPVHDEYIKFSLRRRGSVQPIPVTLGMMGELEFLYAVSLGGAKPTRWKQRQEKSIHAAGSFYLKGGYRVPLILPRFWESPRTLEIAGPLIAKIGDVERGRLPPSLREALLRALSLLKPR